MKLNNNKLNFIWSRCKVREIMADFLYDRLFLEARVR